MGRILSAMKYPFTVLGLGTLAGALLLYRQDASA
jgi:hypothetical protein